MLIPICRQAANQSFCAVAENQSAKLGAFGVTRRESAAAEIDRSHRVSPRKTFRVLP